MSALDDLSKQYSDAYNAAGMSNADFAKTPQYKQITGQYNDALGQLTDPAEIDAQINKIQKFQSDPNSAAAFGPQFQQYISTLSAQKKAATAPPVVNGNPAGAQPNQVPAPGAPGYTDGSGTWKEGDASVANRVQGMIQSGNPLMEAAEANALKVGNRMGLANSSMTAGAAQKAMIETATPIATTDANNVQARNLSGQNFREQSAITGQQNASTERIAGMQITADQSRQMADLAAQKERLGLQLTSEERIALDNRKAEDARAQNQNANTLNIAGMQAKTAQTEGIATAVANANSTLSSRINAINANNDIPADARRTAILDAQRQHDTDMDIIQQTFGVKLDWTRTPADTGTTTTANTTGAPGLT